MSEPVPTTAMRGVRGALLRYRVMAYLVGCLLVVLVVIGLPMKYIWHDELVVRLTGIPHGWLYMVLLITAYDLGRRVHWSWKRLILIALAGTVPFLSFVAERSATKNVRARLHPTSPDTANPPGRGRTDQDGHRGQLDAADRTGTSPDHP